MERLNSIFSSLRLPNISQPALNLPCEATIEFFFLCGHTVTSRRCRNHARIMQGIPCDETCPTRNLPTLIHMESSCAWCRSLPPEPGSTRSDPGIDRLDSGEIRRRQDIYLSTIRPALGDSTRNEFFGNVGSLARWATYRRLENEFMDSQNYDLAQRTFFIGGGYDEWLYVPLDRSTIPEDPDDRDGRCLICLESLREGAPPVALPCHDGHRFHTDCVDQWLSVHASCPACRTEYRIFSYMEWERMNRERSFINFFLAPRDRPPQYNPDIHGIDGTRARRAQERRELQQAQDLQDQMARQGLQGPQGQQTQLEPGPDVA